MGDTFERLAVDGPLLLAIGAAVLAGLVSFLSPCVLPLVPGYLSYVTGLVGVDLDAALGVRPTAAQPAAAQQPAAGVSVAGVPDGAVAVAAPPRPVAKASGRGRVFAGTALFVLGFTVTYTLLAVLASRLGILLGTYRRTVDVVVGLVVVLLGLAFLGLVPGLQREVRIHRLPAAGLLGAPVLGAVFALSWIPCSGPTLGAVLGLATTSGQTDRAAVLAVAYCVGVGVPFMIFGLGYRRLLGVFRAVRRNSRWVTRVGGVLLITMGLIMVAGGWTDVLIWLQTSFGGVGGESLL
jgi:cytochrome c-type biogenesis protein